MCAKAKVLVSTEINKGICRRREEGSTLKGQKVPKYKRNGNRLSEKTNEQSK